MSTELEGRKVIAATVGYEKTVLVECNVGQCLTFFVDKDGKAHDLMSKVSVINNSEISYDKVFRHVFRTRLFKL